jgi:hypothetical protein
MALLSGKLFVLGSGSRESGRAGAEADEADEADPTPYGDPEHGG